jgi:hypothetical protein
LACLHCNRLDKTGLLEAQIGLLFSHDMPGRVDGQHDIALIDYRKLRRGGCTTASTATATANSSGEWEQSRPAPTTCCGSSTASAIGSVLRRTKRDTRPGYHDQQHEYNACDCEFTHNLSNLYAIPVHETRIRTLQLTMHYC